MKPQYVLLQKEIDPSLTILFKEANKYHPEIISDGNGFAIVIEDWEKGTYRFVNSVKEENRVDNVHFSPNNAKSLKTIHDLNNLWKTVTGKPLTYIGKCIEKVELNKVYSTKRGGDLKVIKILDGNKSKVEFYNGYTTIATNVNILRGYIRNPYHPSLFGVGFVGEGKYDSTTKDVYDRWKSILQRCYDENSRHIYKNYKDVTVCEEWYCLQNFGTWYEQKYDSNTMQGWAVDKDLLSNDAKIYSPLTCAFVPPPINNVLVKSNGVDNGLPTGVVKNRQKYYAYFYKGGEPFNSPGYDTIEKASAIYAFEKDKYIKELAEEYKDRLDPRVYLKLINYNTPTYMEK